MRANVVANEDGNGYFDEQIIRSTCLGSDQRYIIIIIIIFFIEN